MNHVKRIRALCVASVVVRVKTHFHLWMSAFVGRQMQKSWHCDGYKSLPSPSQLAEVGRGTRADGFIEAVT